MARKELLKQFENALIRIILKNLTTFEEINNSIFEAQPECRKLL